MYNHLVYHHLSHLSSLHTAAPVINTPSSSTETVAIGSSLTLSCTSGGSPPDTFTWRKDNDTTVLQSTFTAVDRNNAMFCTEYSIDSVTTSHSGMYTCTITNPIGSDNTTITVVVEGTLLIIHSKSGGLGESYVVSLNCFTLASCPLTDSAIYVCNIDTAKVYKTYYYAYCIYLVKRRTANSSHNHGNKCHLRINAAAFI